VVATADPVALGRRIADARERSGLTQAKLAATVSLDRSALVKIENGKRRVSALELARVADALGERIEWFVTDPPAAVVSYRNLLEPGATSPVIDRVVERVARNVEFVLRHDGQWNLVAPPETTRPGTVQDAEACASKARALLGLDAVAPFVDMSARLSRVGLVAFSFDLGPEAADAASVLLEHGGVAVVNGHLHVGRRRLALAHELGHYLFADAYAVDWRIAEQDDDAAWETRLDRFARAVLLPASGLRPMWAELRAQGDDLRTAAVKVGSAFRVDMATLARRLWELGQVGQGDARQIRAVRTTRADIVELNLLVHDELAAPWLTRRYEEAVLRLYRNEIVSPARATDLLFEAWDEEDLPSLPALPESAMWKFVS
jgi:Zn-dependent peptidase ImmA (M78 family)/transcriptional regulator with XRE-family HTH domain